MKPIALQTYTVRDAMEQDFHGTLKAIADLGYRGVETAGLYGQEPQQIAQAVADLGLIICSNHGGLPTQETLAETVDFQKALGSDRLGSGFGPDDMKTVADCKVCAEKLQTGAELLKPHGITVHVHNHYWEFARVEDGRYPYEIIMAEAPDLLSELDLYWVAFGGADPVEILGRYSSRVELVHAKDGLLGEKFHFKALGAGQVDLPAAIQAIDLAVTEWLIVEQDASDGDMMEDVKTSYEYLISRGLAVGNR